MGINPPIFRSFNENGRYMEETLRNKYVDYGFEDFLHDSYFIESVNNPTEESEAFWKNELIKMKRVDEYRAACEYIKSISNDTDDVRLSDDEIGNLEKEILMSFCEVDKRRLLTLNIFKIIGIAASFFLLCLVGYKSYINYYSEKDKLDIMTFAMNSKQSEEKVSDEIVLLLSDDRKISMKDDESVINYGKSSETISIGKEEKKEKYVEKESVAQYNELITPRGKRSKLVLADGSNLWVNSGTRVVYPKSFSSDKREIFVDGEIYIEVAPDKGKPFYVRTKGMDVRVLGTKFNVSSYSDEQNESVVLVSGSVSVGKHEEAESTVVLTPSQKYNINDGDATVETVNVKNYICWINGVLYYDQKSIIYILSDLAKYYGVNVNYNLSEDFAENNLYTGRLEIKPTFDEALKSLGGFLPIKFDKKGNNLYCIKF